MPELNGLISAESHITMIVGKKGSGKSNLFLQFLLNPNGWFRKYDRVVFISPTFRAQYEILWNKLDPKGVRVYDAVSQPLLADLIAEQETNNLTTLVCFDDNGEELRHVGQADLNRFISNSRHLRLSCVFLCQKISQVPTVVRANCDCFVVFAACAQVELEALYREVSIVDKKRFLDLFREVTQHQYAFLCISVQKGKIKFFKNCQEQIVLE